MEKKLEVKDKIIIIIIFTLIYMFITIFIIEKLNRIILGIMNYDYIYYSYDKHGFVRNMTHIVISVIVLIFFLNF